MKKRLMSLCCAFMLCVAPCSTVYADYDYDDDEYYGSGSVGEIEPYWGSYSPTGKCGNDLTYVLDEKKGVLTISGTGEMWDSDEPVANAVYTPWVKDYIFPWDRYEESEDGEEQGYNGDWTEDYETDEYGEPYLWDIAAVSNIKKIIIEEGVTRIAWGAFHGLKELTSVSIPSTVYEISGMSFAGCTALKEINVPKTVEIIGYGAFYKTAWYDAQPNGLVIINNILYSYKGNEIKGDITVPDSVTRISNLAFYDTSYTEGTKINIEHSVMVEPNSIWIGKDGWAWKTEVIDGIEYFGDEKIGYVALGFERKNEDDEDINENIENIDLKFRDGTIGIARNAFCPFYTTVPYNIRNVTIPSSVQIIDPMAFYGHGIETAVIENPNCKILGDHSVFCYGEFHELEEYIGYEMFDELYNNLSEKYGIDWDEYEQMDEEDPLYPEYKEKESEFESEYEKESDKLLKQYQPKYGLHDTNTTSSCFEIFEGKICGYNGSTAEAFAKKYNYLFESITSGDTVEVTTTSVETSKPTETTMTTTEKSLYELHYTPDKQPQKTAYLDAKSNNYNLENYAEKWDSSIYCSKMARLLSILASSAYTLDDITHNLTELGFSNFQTYNYYSSATDPNYKKDSCGFSIAKTKLESGDFLMLITIRGSYGALDKETLTHENSDWYSNLNPENFKEVANNSILHLGFFTAAMEIANQLQKSLRHLPATNAKFIITGHSRGAGIGNLLAKYLIDIGTPKENVFAYNFACPDVAKTSYSGFNPDDKYNSIFNLNVVGDPVTVLPGATASYFLMNDDTFLKKRIWGKYGNSFWFADDWYNIPITNLHPSLHDHGNYVRMFSQEQEKWDGKSLLEVRKQQWTQFATTIVFEPKDMLKSGKHGLPPAIGSKISATSNEETVSKNSFNVEVLDTLGTVLANIHDGEIEYISEDAPQIILGYDENNENATIIHVIGRNDIKFRVLETDSSAFQCQLTSYSDKKLYSECSVFYDNITISSNQTAEISLNTKNDEQSEHLGIFDSTGKEINVIKAKEFTPSRIFGDMNEDECLTISDAVKLARYVAEDQTLQISERAISQTDVNRDGNTDSEDCTELLKILALTA